MSTPPAPQPPHSHLYLFALTAGLIGLQFCWAVQVGYVTKSLLQLGLAQRFVSYAWLAGPIAGIIVQPTVGVLSDRCTSTLGRRRPFLIAGSLVTILCLYLFAYAAPIGILLGDPPLTAAPDAAAPDHALPMPRSLAVAVFAFWALDFAINAAQGPLRALLADVVAPAQHKLGNSYFALSTGLGNFSGSLLGSFQLSRFLPFDDDLQALYSVASFVLLLTMGCTVLTVHETPLDRSYQRLPSKASENHHEPHPIPDYPSLPPAVPAATYDSLDTPVEPPRQIGFFSAAFVAPRPFFRVFLVQCFTWFAWFTMFVFATSWVGAEVYNGRYDAPRGSPERDLYDSGVRKGNLGISLQSVLTIFSSLVLPAILARFSTESVYFFSHILLGGALAATMLLHHRWQAWIATALLASTGFSWAVTMAVPWSVMSEAVSATAPERAGIYFTMFNLSQCLPEIVVSLLSEEIERITGSQAAVLFLGGISAFIGGALILFLGVGRSAPEDHARLGLKGEDAMLEEVDVA